MISSAKACWRYAPPWFTGHWSDWHRGHGCPSDDGASRSEAATAEIAQHSAHNNTGYLTDAELGVLRTRTTAGDTLLVRALNELLARRVENEQRTSELAEAIAIFDATWCTEHGHSPKHEHFVRIEELRRHLHQEPKWEDQIDDD
jgi:hypothetical protein